MTEIRFYHLQHMRLDQALPGILTQALKRGMRVVVKMTGAQRLKEMDTHLWSFQAESFLPHGSKDNPDRQPVWLTLKDENPNGANLLILTESTHSDMIDAYDMVCEIFDGMDDNAVQAARVKWLDLKKAQEHQLVYYQQNEKGGWEEKASA